MSTASIRGLYFKTSVYNHLLIQFKYVKTLPCGVGAGGTVGLVVVGVQVLDLFDQGGGGVGHLFGRLDKSPLGRLVVGGGRGLTARVADDVGVLGNDSGGRQDLLLARIGVAQYLQANNKNIILKSITKTNIFEGIKNTQ